MNHLVLFADGASKGNPGPGGWGAVLVAGESVIELGGREDHTTNNRMELRAAIEGLRVASTKEAGELEVRSDSSYVINGITKWVAGWKNNGWRTKAGGAVLNQDLWEDLADAVEACAHHRIRFVYVPGHSGVVGNERVDQIASDLAEKIPVTLFVGKLETYPLDILNVDVDETLTKKKSSSKAKAFSYVSEVGGVVEVHATWAECLARVKGTMARFKKSISAEDEKKIIQEFSSPR